MVWDLEAVVWYIFVLIQTTNLYHGKNCTESVNAVERVQE